MIVKQQHGKDKHRDRLERVHRSMVMTDAKRSISLNDLKESFALKPIATGAAAPPHGCRQVRDDRGEIRLVGIGAGAVLGVPLSQ